MIRSAELKDIPRIAEIHTKALPNDLLPRLGQRYLQKYLYPTILNSAHSLTLVHSSNDKIDSFVVFAKNSEQLSKELSSGYLSILRALATKIPMDPTIPLEILRFMFGSIEWESRIEEYPKTPELFTIATDPSVQSKGLGAQLVAEGISRLSKLPARGCLVKTSAEKARGFYKKNGFSEVGLEKRGHRNLYLLFRPFTEITE